MSGPLDPFPPETRALLDRAAALEIETPLGARERVWRRIATTRAKRWRAPVFAAGALCAVAATSLILFLLARAPDELAVVIRGNGMRRGLAPNEATAPLAELSLVDLHTAGQCVVGRDTVARVDHLGRGLVVTVERGTVLLHVRPRDADTPFVVRTPRFSVQVVGTILRVTVGPDGDGVAVGHGAVLVSPVEGTAVRVGSGQRWPASVANTPTVAELDRLGPTELEGVSAASFGEPIAAAPRCEGDFAESLGCRLEAARAEAGPSAEASLYQLGESAWRTLGDRARALAIWREERARFPTGALAQEVDESIIDALVGLHRSEDARREIVAYLAAHPQSARAAEMHFVLGTLFRDLDGDCRRAGAELDRALLTPGAPWGERARAARRGCDTIRR